MTGDFNNDGFSDLAIGVPREDLGSLNQAGAVSVIYGSAGRLSPTTVVPDQFWNQNSANIEDAAESRDLFGRALG